MFFKSNPVPNLVELQECTYPTDCYTPLAVVRAINLQREKEGKVLFSPVRGNIFAWLASMQADKIKFLLSGEASGYTKTLSREDPDKLEVLNMNGTEVSSVIYKTLRSVYATDALAKEWRKYPPLSKPDILKYFGIDSDTSIEENRVYVHISQSGIRRTNKKESHIHIPDGKLAL